MSFPILSIHFVGKTHPAHLVKKQMAMGKKPNSTENKYI
jgi:hypothetical protein